LVTGHKTFRVVIAGTTGAAPNAWAGDVNATLSVTVTNTANTQSLGSLNLTVPAPFVLISSPSDTLPGGPVVEVRNLSLQPGKSVVIQLVVAVDRCTPAAGAPFTIKVKQSNNFNGTGNDFTLQQPSDLQVDVVGTCALRWVAQPSDAERGATITSAPFTPAGAPLTLNLVDGGGVDLATRATGNVTLAATNASVGAPSLGGTTSAPLTSGVATFSPGPTLAPSAFDYTLDASSIGLTGSGPSGPFDIVDDAAPCPAGGACGAATASGGGVTSSAQFGAGASATTLTVSVNAADAPSFSCAGYPRGSRPISGFVFSGDLGGDRTGTFATVIPNASILLHKYEVCWAAPYQFRTQTGAWATVGATKPGTGEALYVGILPDCSLFHTWRNAETGGGSIPCVTRSYDFGTKAATITVRATGQDPWRY
jgi:hypothetical protein